MDPIWCRLNGVWTQKRVSEAEMGKHLPFTNELMVFALFFFFLGGFQKTEHNESMLSGRMNVSTLLNGTW